MHNERAPDNPFIYKTDNWGDIIPPWLTPFAIEKVSEVDLPHLYNKRAAFDAKTLKF